MKKVEKTALITQIEEFKRRFKRVSQALTVQVKLHIPSSNWGLNVRYFIIIFDEVGHNNIFTCDQRCFKVGALLQLEKLNIENWEQELLVLLEEFLEECDSGFDQVVVEEIKAITFPLSPPSPLEEGGLYFYTMTELVRVNGISIKAERYC